MSYKKQILEVGKYNKILGISKGKIIWNNAQKPLIQVCFKQDSNIPLDTHLA